MRFVGSVLAIALVQLVGSGVLAADLTGYRPYIAPEVEDFTSGWYLRGDVEAVRRNDPFLGADGTLSGSLTDRRNSWGGGVGFGFQWNPWIRTDATFEGMATRSNSRSSLTSANPVTGAPNVIVCPYSLHGLQTQDQTPILLGYLYDTTNTCRNDASATERRLTALFNGYFDLAHYHGVTPYLGAGVGFTAVSSNGSSSYYKTSDGSAYNTDLSPSGSYPQVWLDQAGNPIPYATKIGSDSTKSALTFGPQNWNTSSKQTYFRPAWALTAGVAFDLTAQMKLDVNYRYVNLGSYTVVQADGSTTRQTVTNQAVRIGLRYTP